MQPGHLQGATILGRVGLDDRQLFQDVREVLIRHDLEGLIVLGCPDNEYDMEVERILPQLAAARDAADVAAIVQKVFVEMFGEKEIPSAAAVAAAADEIWLLYQEAAERHSPEDISLMLAQKDVEGIVFRLGMSRLLLAGVLVHGVEVNDLFRLLRAVDASELADRLISALMQAQATINQRRGRSWVAEASELGLFDQLEAGDTELADRLDRALDDQATHFALTVDDRTIVLNALDDPPEGLATLRTVLMSEHQSRQRDGLG